MVGRRVLAAEIGVRIPVSELKVVNDIKVLDFKM